LIEGCPIALRRSVVNLTHCFGWARDRNGPESKPRTERDCNPRREITVRGFTIRPATLASSFNGWDGRHRSRHPIRGNAGMACLWQVLTILGLPNTIRDNTEH